MYRALRGLESEVSPKGMHGYLYSRTLESRQLAPAPALCPSDPADSTGPSDPTFDPADSSDHTPDPTPANAARSTTFTTAQVRAHIRASSNSGTTAITPARRTCVRRTVLTQSNRTHPIVAPATLCAKRTTPRRSYARTTRTTCLTPWRRPIAHMKGDPLTH